MSNVVLVNVARAMGVGVVGVALLVSPPATDGGVEGAAIRDTVRGAITDAMDAGTYKSTTWTSGPLDGATIRAMHSTLDSRLREHMTGRALATWKRALDDAIDRDSDGHHVVATAGGVDQIQLGGIGIDGDQARAEGRARIWVDWVIHGADVAGPHDGHPAGWDRFTAMLDRVNGRWYVEELSLEPEAGG